MRQTRLFTEGEGDRWFERNAARLGERDPVSAVIEHLNIKPKHVLEIGSANGWRLAKLREKYGCEVMGLEPSNAAAEAARAQKVATTAATAAGLPLRANSYDVVIYGFCLYLTDPEDWFMVVLQGDRVLADDGYLIIHDFNTGSTAFKQHYEHADGVFSYHVQWSKFWLAHPWYYRVLGRPVGSDESVTVLRKRAFIPVAP